MLPAGRLVVHLGLWSVAVTVPQRKDLVGDCRTEPLQELLALKEAWIQQALEKWGLGDQAAGKWAGSERCAAIVAAAGEPKDFGGPVQAPAGP